MVRGWIDEGCLHGSAILPRLDLVAEMVREVREELSQEIERLRRANDSLAGSAGYDEYQAGQLELERTLSVVAESAARIGRKLGSISDMGSIPETAPALVPATRAASSLLHPVIPHLSRDLCLISSILGSIVMDSGTIAGAMIDLRRAGSESARMLSEASLAVRSRMCAMHPRMR